MARASAAADPLAALLASAEKKYNLSVGPVSAIAQEAHFISTGNIAIDKIIGGGLPLGRSVELSGPPSSGKTTTALQAAAVLQGIFRSGGDASRGIKADDKILYLDYEQTIDQVYAASLGLDINDESFLLTQPDTFEDGANFAIAAIATGRIRMVIWDSVASMMPSANAMNEIGKSMAFTQARLMSDLGQKLNPLLYNNNTLNIFVNHLKKVLDMTGSRPSYLAPAKDTPGGQSLKFYVSVRVEYKQLNQIKEKVIDELSGEEIERPGATNVEVKVTKNKVAPPFRKAIVRVRYGKGFDNFWTAMQLLVASKQVMFGQGTFYFHKTPTLITEWMPKLQSGTNRPYIKGERALFKAADDFPEWRAEAIRLAEIIAESGTALDAITPTDESEDEVQADEDGVVIEPAEHRAKLLG